MHEHHFRDVRFMTATEKRATLRAWIRFLKHDLVFASFSKRLYDHLVQHCSFIAHFNRIGFYLHYFDSNSARVCAFLSQFDGRGECLSTEYGIDCWLSGDYEDINRAMIAEAGAYIPKLLEAALLKQRNQDLATARALMQKHGIFSEVT
jgi:hypothetical protein